jgi:hypothetical protein
MGHIPSEVHQIKFSGGTIDVGEIRIIGGNVTASVTGSDDYGAVYRNSSLGSITITGGR